MIKRATDDNARLAEYLLGRLPPEEEGLIEQRYLADPAFHDELRAAERDLIDQYVQGEIANPEEFERHFLSSPPRRQRVEFARALSRSLARAPVVGDTVSGPEPNAPWASWHRLLGTSPRAWQAAAATVVLLVGGWLVVSNRPGQNPTNPVAPTGRQEPEPGAVVQEREVARPSQAEPSSSVRVVTLVLTANLTRSREETPTLRINRDTGVRLELHSEASDYERYRATIRTADGREIWRQDQIRLSPTISGPAIVVTLPAGRLDDEDYTIRLSGMAPRGEFEEIAGYSFRVRRQ